MSKHVLLTGGGGAIGVHVVKWFLQETDWTITIIDSYRHKGDPTRVANLLKSHTAWRDRVRVIKHDLCCPISVQMAAEIGAVDYILHLAAMSDVFLSVENPVYCMKNNIDSTIVMLEYARNTPHAAFIYFSTDEVYGPVERGGAHKEWDAHKPSNAYSASKAASEDLCYAYWRGYGVKLIVTNTMNNFGETQAPSKYPSMIQQRLENGEPITVHASNGEIGTRYYIHSEDVADALLFILQNLPAHEHETGALDEPDRYHLVGSACVDNESLVRIIAGITGDTPQIEYVDFHSDNPAHDIHYGLEDNKLRAAGWSEHLGFDTGMRRCVEWERAQL